MFKLIKHEDSGGMHIKVIRRELSPIPAIKDIAEKVVRLYGVNRKKGDFKEVTKKKEISASGKHGCGLCEKEFATELGLKIHTMKKHK